VLQAANHPLTPAAEEYLEARGVALLPDILVNIGGMVGCYAEWQYRQLSGDHAHTLEELAARCHAYTARVVEDNVRSLMARRDGTRAACAEIVRANRAAALAGDHPDLLGAT